MAILTSLGAARRFWYQLFGCGEAVSVQELEEGPEGGPTAVLDHDLL